MRMALFGIAVVLGACVLPLCGEPVRAATSHPAQVAAEDVVQGLADAGITIQPSQVSFLADIPATGEHAELELLSLEPLATTRAKTRAKMRCADPSQCIPFYVEISGIADAHMGKRDVPSDTGKDPAAKPLSKGNAGITSRPREPVILKQGSAATLQMATSRMLITMPVICLQNGHKGERVRVTSVDRTKIFVAEVISANYLRAGLQQ